MQPKSCKICGHPVSEFLFKAESKRYAPGEYFDLYRCHRCSGICIKPFLEFSDAQKYYPLSYAPHDPKQTKSNNIREAITRHLRKYVYGSRINQRATDINTIRRLFSGILQRLTYRSFPWPIVDGKLLDIGCGNGTYLAAVEELGWHGFGCESNSSAAQYATKSLGLEVQAEDFEAVVYPEKHFDVITMWHSLEHFSDPKKIIGKVRKLLKDDGVLMIGIPNFYSFDRKLFKESWNGLEIPLHAWHFTPASIRYLLKNNGFKKIIIHNTTRPTDMAKSLNYLLEDRYRLKPHKTLSMCLFLLSIPVSMCFSMCRRSSIIKVYAI
ncbi:MAG: class I SAM-dependent methyltransferase [Desulfobacterales bacterium]|nr:MAG: class I SAM-dependent methyltransferase [Desulfobacterales bacterium]